MLDEDAHRLIAVAGDFNAEDHEAPLRIVIGAEEDTGNGALAAREPGLLDRAHPRGPALERAAPRPARRCSTTFW